MTANPISRCAALLGLLLVTTGAVPVEAPLKVTPCALKADPEAYDHRLVEVSGFVSHGFEDFSLIDPSCASGAGIWLEYGGTVGSGTIFCCGVSADRHRPEPMSVEKIRTRLVEDRVFHEFDKLIQRESILIHATLIGRFFAGHEQDGPGGESPRGYGHFGCCSLLAIQQIRDVDSVDRRDVDYDPAPDQPDVSGVGCGYRDLTGSFELSKLIAAQHEAEERRPWAFDDPLRVAREAFDRFAVAGTAFTLAETRRSQGRIVFASAPSVGRSISMVVVSRPYLVTFYARDPRQTAWIAVAAYESFCDRPESAQGDREKP